MEYNPTSQICNGKYAVPAKCNDEGYNPLIYGCCGNSTFPKSTQFCHTDNHIYDKCGGTVEFNPETQFCQSPNIVKDFCNAETYTAIKFCYDNNLYDKCGGTMEYNPIKEGCCKSNENNTYSTYTLKRTHYGREKDQFCDERDGKTYVYVAIPEDGTGQKWMAENMNYKTSDGTSRCHTGKNYNTNNVNDYTNTNDDDNANCTNSNGTTKYGRLYNWATAMALDQSYNTTSFIAPENHQGICPSGWHIPSNEDWDILIKSIDPSCENKKTCSNVGAKLKTTDGWYVSLPHYNGNGTDDYGFSALPGGIYEYNFSYFDRFSHSGYWWSSSEVSINFANSRYMDTREDFIYQFNYKDDLFSVRCLQD